MQGRNCRPFFQNPTLTRKNQYRKYVDEHTAQIKKLNLNGANVPTIITSSDVSLYVTNGKTSLTITFPEFDETVNRDKFLWKKQSKLSNHMLDCLNEYSKPTPKFYVENLHLDTRALIEAWRFVVMEQMKRSGAAFRNPSRI